MALEEMEAHAKYCKAHNKQQLKGGDPLLRCTHLHNCLINAHAKKVKECTRQIKAKMEKESNSKMWYWINHTQKDPRCGTFHVVQRVVDGILQESDGQEETEDFIFEEMEVRFQLAAKAPISKTKLIKQLGYLGDSEIAKQLIEGHLQIPDEIDDATALILEEIGKIGILTNREVTIDITPEEFQYFWKRIRDGTASSYSSIHHYSHYKAAAYSDRFSSFLSKKITLLHRK